MDNSKNTNTKKYIIKDSTKHKNNFKTLNPNTNNPCKITLGKTIYFFRNKSDINTFGDDFNCDEKIDITFTPCDIVENTSVNIENPYDSRLLVFNVRLKNIHPDKSLILRVLVYENSKLYAFKAKKFSTLGLSYSKCKNIDSGKFSFIFYGDKPLSQRKLKVKFSYNYVRP